MKREPLILLAVFVVALLVQLSVAPDVASANDAFAIGYRFGSATGKALHFVGYAAIALILYRRWKQRPADRATMSGTLESP
ncbi:hypothetical protein EA658_06030 [Pseudoxanthomonas winnipegensis]|jgi:hypothetical protein|uniref:Uncharacterized protein n=1 Tax=Pseudoxanthomonas winnipegensis TaxID=2480810 RepID=A0ABY1WF53_9GAMM|nr:hypothetical protein [Pseudoxanthomonas winnipegensis]TAA08816.1 hypothetical protein EA659_13265 [Pseudoxanthomonas winnipegensis]TAA20516.1 hypothetical protein EA658_06030 [Pseudoxanthomonas winnipegensis]TAH71830.1 hypothetical protein EA657_11960 [Pseudoxanthomonas winnipegensis]